ncbi:MAG: nuclear transport factor 2 family protein [Haloarculaceae archaeon]
MDAETTVREYYETLRAGDPLSPYFADDERAVKFGISETLRGGPAIAEGLREQTETTAGWEVESQNLVVGEREGWAHFADEVFMAWTDTEKRIRYEFDTRWSGTLEQCDGGWQFVAMHVSTAGDL